MRFYGVKLVNVLLYLSIILVSNASFADPLPDYYSEPGVNPFRDYSTKDVSEIIDPLSGGLIRQYTDLIVPGNGGLDIQLIRTYRAPSGTPGELGGGYLAGKTILGEGWDMHLGRVWINASYTARGGCGTGQALSGKNPVLELPDGTRKELFDANSATPYGFISSDLWIGICITSGGLTAVSPDGMRYTFGKFGSYGTQSAWHATKIQDTSGNYLDIVYDTGTNQTIIKEITAYVGGSKDGRSVTFTYENRTTFNVLLTEIKLDNQTKVTYVHSPIVGISSRYYLDSATRAGEGGAWTYSYYETRPQSDLWGLHAMEEVRSPSGQITTYTYGGVNFHPLKQTTTLKTKKVSGGGIATGTWTYSYSPSAGSITQDITTIRSPRFCTKYAHRGANLPKAQSIWRIGTLESLSKYNNTSCSGTPVEKVELTWSSLSIANQDRLHRRDPVNDSNIYMPVLATKKITRDGDVFTTNYSSFDGFGNPQTVAETGPNLKSRTTTFTYNNFSSSSDWILGLVDKQTITGVGTIDNDYVTSGSAKGKLSQRNVFGRITKFSYYLSAASNGSLYQKTDENGNTTTYSSYYRGSPKTETMPEGVTIKRDINQTTGTVLWEEDPRGNRVSYQYDDFNRLKKIETARFGDSDVSISWSIGGRVKTVTRGDYVSKVTSDSRGNILSSSTNGVYKSYSYDAEGLKTFESFPAVTSTTTAGDRYSYDVLGRISQVTHQDNSTAIFYYDVASANSVAIKNERGLTTTYQFDSYGDPDERYLSKITSPEGITTVIGRDKIGNQLSISQGGKTRTIALDSRKLMDYRDDPETGRTDVSIDNAGNITERKVGSSSLTTYTYDGLNRVERINYPTGTADIDFGFDYDLLESVGNGTSNWTYVYDENSNLESETLTLSGIAYGLSYSYDNKDNLLTVTYPNGLVVNYSPDSLGRPTKVTPVVTSITYFPDGSPKVVTYANGIQTTISQDSRLRTSLISAPGVIKLGYGYDGVNNVKTVTDGIAATNNLTLGYDDVDRLETAQGPWGAGFITYSPSGDILTKQLGSETLTFNYDSISNRLLKVTKPPIVGSITPVSTVFSFNYDVYGNATSGSGSNTFNYNDASQLTGIPLSSGSEITYAYDGNGNRVSKSFNGEIQQTFLYAKDGRLMYEVDRPRGVEIAYIYLGSKLIAKQEFGDPAVTVVPKLKLVDLPLCEPLMLPNQNFLPWMGDLCGTRHSKLSDSTYHTNGWSNGFNNSFEIALSTLEPASSAVPFSKKNLDNTWSYNLSLADNYIAGAELKVEYKIVQTCRPETSQWNSYYTLPPGAKVFSLYVNGINEIERLPNGVACWTDTASSDNRVVFRFRYEKGATVSAWTYLNPIWYYLD